MSRRRSPPRLYLDPERRTWIIRDGSRRIRTGCREAERQNAESQLAEYLGGKYKLEPSESPLIAETLAAYAQEVVPTKPTRKARLNVGYSISRLLDWWKDRPITDITSKTCREFLAHRTPTGGPADLKILKAALRHWSEEYGPLTVMPQFYFPPSREPRDRWLTRDEAARLLRAAKPYQHLRRAILLGLYTGSRPGVILSLQWDQIDLVSGVMSRKRPGEVVSGSKRAPKVRLGRRIIAHLKRWKRIDGHLCPCVCHYNGRAISHPDGSWKRAVTKAGLTDITRHTWRHTRATWLMQAGVDIWEAAGHLGMSTKTLERVYAHHHPRHQERAANV